MDNESLIIFLDELKEKIKNGKISEELGKKIGELKMAELFDNNFREETENTYMKYFITGWYIYYLLEKNSSGK